MCLLFAATYPERTQALILYGTYARWLRSADNPIGMSWQEWHAMLAEMEGGWGGPAGLDWYAPSLKEDPRMRQMWGGFLRTGASPAAGLALLRMNEETNVRPALAAIHVPTLVLHRSGDRLIAVAHGRYLAEHLADAKRVESPGVDHIPLVGGGEDITSEIQHFLTGLRSMPEPDRQTPDGACGRTPSSSRMRRRRTAMVEQIFHGQQRAKLAFQGVVGENCCPAPDAIGHKAAGFPRCKMPPPSPPTAGST